ncbi:MAG TPA: hypothetical protein VF681_14630 [Abditibacteriaceae bacterium]
MNSTVRLTPTDFYADLLTIKSGNRGCHTVTKKDAKAAGMDWKFIENAVAVLELQIRRDGRWGFVISK